MNASAAAKSPAQNRLEGFALAAILQGFPTFAMAVLLVKLTHGHEFVTKIGAVTFVMLATLIYALLISWLAATFPRTFAHAYEPLFFDASLPFTEKVARWRARPATSLQLLTTVLAMSLLAEAVASVR